MRDDSGISAYVLSAIRDARVRDVVGVGAVRVDEVLVLADRVRVLLLLEVGVGDAKLRHARVLRVAVLALDLAHQRLRLDPVVRVVLLHRRVVRALRVLGVAERGLGALRPRSRRGRGRRAERRQRGRRRRRRARAAARMAARTLPAAPRRRQIDFRAPAHDAPRRGLARPRGRACRPRAAGGGPARRCPRERPRGELDDHRRPRPTTVRDQREPRASAVTASPS